MNKKPIDPEAARSKSETRSIVFVILLSVVFFVWMFGDPDPTAQKSETKTAQEVLHDRLAGAVAQCMGAVRGRSKFPNKAKLEPNMLDFLERLKTTPETAKTFVYHGRVDLMNGFGAMIPHRYVCVIDIPNWSFTKVSVTPG